MDGSAFNLTESRTFANDSTSDPICHLKSMATHFGLGLVIVLIVIGIAGNSMVCFILIYMRRRLSLSTLQYVISVASSDLLTCILVMPFDVVYWLNFPRWPLGPVYCKLWNALYFMFHASSSFGIIAISIDTYVTVSKPFQIPRRTRLSSKCIIFLIWMWSFAVGALIFAFQKDPPLGVYFFQLHSVPFSAYLIVHLIAPQIVAGFCYFKLFRISKMHAIKIQKSSIETESTASTTTQSSTKSLTFGQKIGLAKTFLFISVAHFMLWNPFLAVQSIYVLQMEEHVDWCALEIADTIVCWLTYLQCCLNPCLYALRKNYFHVLFKEAVNPK